MKIKLLLVIFALSLVLAFSCFASFEHKYVEISFKVGDSILGINGEEVSVETPYIVGEGVTLVPVRVITEAFGAEVEWNGTERKVSLTTEEKSIELWIGKDTASINGEELPLLSAPEISNNVTMVPLRFISEGFGAEVSYENETKLITVILDKGPVVENGMKFFDDGIISVSVPEDYDFVSDGRLNYKFTKTSGYNYSDHDTIWNYDFVVPALENPEEVLGNDKSTQSALVKNKNYVVSSVEKRIYNGIEKYSYTILYKKNSSSSLCVKKSIYNFGDYTYFTISVYDGCYNTGKTVYDEDGRVTSIDYSAYKLTVPEEFSNVRDPIITSFEVSGKAIPEIEVQLYKKGKDFEEKSFLEEREDSYRYIIDQINLNASRVKEYEIGEETLLGYELSYAKGGREYYLISSTDKYFVLFKFGEDSFDKAPEIISDFKFDETEENLKKLWYYDENEYITVETDTFTFELPSSFEVYYSNEGKFLYAVDSKTKLVFNFYHDITTIANETWGSRSYSDSNPMFPKYYVSMERNNSVSELTNNTIETYENNGWEVTKDREFDDFSIDGYNEDMPIDLIICNKTVGNGIKIYQRGWFLMTDTEEYTLSNEEERIQKLQRILESGDFKKEYNLCDQKVHGFVFTYTNMFNEKDVDKMCEDIIKSINVKG